VDIGARCARGTGYGQTRDQCQAASAGACLRAATKLHVADVSTQQTRGTGRVSLRPAVDANVLDVGADGGRIRSARVTFFGSVSLPWWLECSVALGQLGSKLSVHLDWRGYTAEHRTFDRRKREGCKMISRSGVVRADIRG